MKRYKKFFNLVWMLVSLWAFSCVSEKKENENEATATDKIINQKDFMSWWRYQNKEINLSSDFVGMNPDGEELSKVDFFKQLNTGEFIPVKIETTDEETYRLHKLNWDANPGIRKQIKRLSGEHLRDYQKLGTPFPEFSFTDLEGNVYSNESLRGKTVVIKTWFIGCSTCIAEFPQLNQLVDLFAAEDDVIFISLATNSKDKLVEFLQEKPTNYKVIASQGTFISEKLKVDGFPTHIVVGKDGDYERIPDNADRLIAYLFNTKFPPPPPPVMIGEL